MEWIKKMCLFFISGNPVSTLKSSLHEDFNKNMLFDVLVAHMANKRNPFENII